MSGPTPPPAALPATDESPATMSADQQPPATTDSHSSVMTPSQTATQPRVFGPGTGRAFFSTDLGARPPRSLPSDQSLRPPVIVRTRGVNVPVGAIDVAAVVQTASYWQRKYKAQCLCIFPSQGWVVKDLWDEEDIHVESRGFCEEMLTFISRDTCYAAMKFAEDWSRAHPDRLNSLGGDMGNVNDPNDLLTIVDNVFIFGELNDFPRVFLWHVVNIMRSTMTQASGANSQVLQQSSIQQGEGGVSKVSNVSPTDAGAPSDIKQQAAIAIDEPDRTPAIGPTQPLPDQHSERSYSQRAPTYGPPPPPGHHPQSRGNIIGGMTGPSMLSPNMMPSSTNTSRGTRNMGSGSYNSPHGYAENANRVVSGPFQRQPSGTMPSAHSPQYMTATMAMGQPLAVPVGGMPPYAQGSPMVPAPAYVLQHFDPAAAPRGHMIQQSAFVQNSPMGPVYMHPPHGPQAASMGEMTNNLHYPNSSATGYVDPRAPVPRRVSHHNTSTLYDPYAGNNRKFNDTTGHNVGNKKMGSSNYHNQPGRGRRVSTSGGRGAYGHPNSEYPAHIPPSGFPNSEFVSRRRSSEDDPAIIGDRVAGCHQTWIGEQNETVTELWIGDLPSGTPEVELRNMFEQCAGVRPIRVNVKTSLGKGPFSHAFVTFSSPSDAKRAFAISRNDPRLRNGSPLTVTVPKRFYQKEVSPGSFGQSYTATGDERNTRGANRMPSYSEDSAVAETEGDSAILSGKSMYSPQDARSGPRKDPAQHTTPTKNTKVERKPNSPVDPPNIPDPMEPVATHLETSATKDVQTKEREAVEPNPEPEPEKPGPSNVANALPKDSAPKQNEAAKPPMDASSQLLELLTPSEITQNEKKIRTKTNLKPSPVETRGPKVNIRHKSAEAMSAAELSFVQTGNNQGDTPDAALANVSPLPADEIASDDEAKNDVSFHSAQEQQSQPRDESSVNQGISHPIKLSDDDSSPLADVLPPQAATTENAPSTAEQPPTYPEQKPVTLKVEQDPSLNTAEDQTPPDRDNAPVSAKNAEPASGSASAAMDTFIAATSGGAIFTDTASTGASSTSTTQRGGAQQSESLNPFAQSKAQVKKEKEAKRKQKKDEANKAKAEKAAAKKAKAEAAASGSVPAPIDELVAATGPISHTAPGNKKAKGKGKAKAADAVAPEQEKSEQGEAEQSGKLIGTDPTDKTKEVDSVTHKAIVARSEKVKLTKEESSIGSGTPCAGPLEVKATPPPSPSPQHPAPSDGAHVVSKKKALIPAVPHLIPPGTSPAHIQGLPSSSILSPTPSYIFPSMPQPSKPDLSPSVSRSRRSSIASSATLHDDDDARPPDVFATPPTSTAAQAYAAGANNAATETPKKKKKKNKKKKKKKTAATPGPESSGAVLATEEPVVPAALLDYRGEPDTHGIDEDYRFYDPFSSQLTHIDALRRAHMYDTESHFARTNKKIEEETKAREEEAKARGEPVEPPKPDSLLRLLEIYGEKAAGKKANADKKLTKEDL